MNCVGSKKQVYLTEVNTLRDFLKGGHDLHDVCLQGIDFQGLEINWSATLLRNTVFLGCTLSPADTAILVMKGAIIFPEIDGLPYKPYRHDLYSWQEMYTENECNESYDLAIYNWFSETKNDPSVSEALYQRIHDHAMDDALRDLLLPDGSGKMDKKCVGIMGGHGVLRTDEYFAKVVRTSHQLAKQGYLVVSGGGPGMMEAANLGAYLANYGEEAVADALEMIKNSPKYTSPRYLDAARAVLSKYPNGHENLAIPTWFYGHEPSNLFASHIAKYFSNSIREDTLLAICLHGIVFAPGSAGTTQEIFQDAAQNHYGTYDFISPMVFLGKHRYQEETNLYQTMQDLAAGRQYQRMLHLTDEPSNVVSFIEANPPQKYEQ